MAKAKKKDGRRPAPKASAYPASSLAPQVLEQAAQGWLGSSGAMIRPSPPEAERPDTRLTRTLDETLKSLRSEIQELRRRLELLEKA